MDFKKINKIGFNFNPFKINKFYGIKHKLIKINFSMILKLNLSLINQIIIRLLNKTNKN